MTEKQLLTDTLSDVGDECTYVDGKKKKLREVLGEDGTVMYVDDTLPNLEYQANSEIL